MTTADSNYFSVSELTEPAWVSTAISNGWLVGEWIAISGGSPTSDYGFSATNSVSAVKSTPVRGSRLLDLFAAWSGGAVASEYGTHGGLIVGLGGGHASYNCAGEVFGFDFNTRQWAEIRADYTGSSSPNSFGEEPDGSPLGFHTYHWPEVMPGYGFTLPQGSVSYAEESPTARYGHYVNLSTGAVTRMAQLNTAFSTKDGSRFAGTSVWLPGLERLLIHGSNSSVPANLVWGTYDPATDTWEELSNGWFTNQQTSMCLDTDLGRVVLADFDFDNISWWPASDPGATRTSISQIGAPSTTKGSGWAYAPNLGAIVYYRSGASVYEMRHSSGSSYAWSSLTAGTNSVTPVIPAENNGCHGRFNVHSWGSRDVAFLVEDTAGPVYAFRLT